MCYHYFNSFSEYSNPLKQEPQRAIPSTLDRDGLNGPTVHFFAVIPNAAAMSSHTCWRAWILASVVSRRAVWWARIARWRIISFWMTLCSKIRLLITSLRATSASRCRMRWAESGTGLGPPVVALGSSSTGPRGNPEEDIPL